MVKIRIDPHTLERAQERGTNAEEIKQVIETGLPQSIRSTNCDTASSMSKNGLR